MYTMQKAKVRLEGREKPLVNLGVNLYVNLCWTGPTVTPRCDARLTNKAKFKISGTYLAFSIPCGLCLCSQEPSE